MQSGLEQTYRRHHGRARKTDQSILTKERSAWLQKWIGKEKNVLDIGCRDGELSKHYAEGNRVLGLDIDQVALDRAAEKTGMDIKQVDLHADWGVENNHYDVVVACEVLEHLYHTPVVLEKINHALKSGGLIVGTIPHAFSLQVRIKFLFGIKASTPLSDPTHINHFSFKEFKGLLSQQFTDLEFSLITTPRYRALSKIFPSLFAHTIMFKGRKTNT